MDHALLLLSDVPGVVVLATLKPGDAVGSSDLLVNTTPGPTRSGNLVLDGRWEHRNTNLTIFDYTDYRVGITASQSF